jgi:hypothetical protein
MMHGTVGGDAPVAKLGFGLHRVILGGKAHPLGNNTRTISHWNEMEVWMGWLTVDSEVARRWWSTVTSERAPGEPA